jgi:hypothetical protein
MTYPDGRHAERPTGSAQPYLQDRQRWPGEPDRPNWPDEAGRPARPGEPDRQGWTGEPDRRGWNGEPDQRGWNGVPDQQGWNGAPDQQGWNGESDQRAWNGESDRPSAGAWLDGPARPDGSDGLGGPDRLGRTDRPGGGPDRPGGADRTGATGQQSRLGGPDQHGRLHEPDRQGGWLGEWERSSRPAETDRQQWGGQPGAEPDPWFPRQRPPVDVPAGAYPDNDWLSPPRTGWDQHTQATPAPEPRDAPSQPASFTAGEEAGLPALLRGKALDRLIAVNASHASHAADKVRTKDDLCEHAIALFSFDLTDKSYPLSTATRLSLSDDGNSSLVDMLTSLANVAEHKVAQAAEHGRRWDPRIPLTGLVNRSEPLSEDMVYLGIGVSTLDTPETPWRSMKGGVDRFSGLHLRGQGYLYLDDRTAGHFVRAAQLGSQTGEHEIMANNMLFSHYSWKRRPDLMEHANQRTYLIWEQIRRLHLALKAATAQ